LAVLSHFVFEVFEALAFKVREVFIIFDWFGFALQNFTFDILLNGKLDALNMSLVISVHVLPQVYEFVTVGSD